MMMTTDKMNSVTLTISMTEKFNYVTQTLTFTMMTKDCIWYKNADNDNHCYKSRATELEGTSFL